MKDIDISVFGADPLASNKKWVYKYSEHSSFILWAINLNVWIFLYFLLITYFTIRISFFDYLAKILLGQPPFVCPRFRPRDLPFFEFFYQVVLLAIKANREEVILLFIKRTAGLIFTKVAKWYGWFVYFERVREYLKMISKKIVNDTLFC